MISFKFLTPSIWTFRLPSHLILQPSFIKKLLKSFTSGSIAQLLSIVLPLALQAAIIKFSVAPTETFGKLIFAPLRPLFAVAYIYPSIIFIFTPIFFKASICKFTGLNPIAHPPGKETFALPNFDNNEPRTSIPALIVLTYLYFATFLLDL